MEHDVSSGNCSGRWEGEVESRKKAPDLAWMGKIYFPFSANNLK